MCHFDAHIYCVPHWRTHILCPTLMHTYTVSHFDAHIYCVPHWRTHILCPTLTHTYTASHIDAHIYCVPQWRTHILCPTVTHTYHMCVSQLWVSAWPHALLLCYCIGERPRVQCDNIEYVPIDAHCMGRALKMSACHSHQLVSSFVISPVAMVTVRSTSWPSSVELSWVGWLQWGVCFMHICSVDVQWWSQMKCIRIHYEVGCVL